LKSVWAYRRVEAIAAKTFQLSDEQRKPLVVQERG